LKHADVDIPSRHIYGSVMGDDLQPGATALEIEHHRSNGGVDTTQLQKCYLWVGEIP
jgi:hypothetical protein